MKKLVLFLALLGCMVLSSCSTRSTIRKEELAESVQRHEFLPTIDLIQKKPKLYGKNNALLYYMDIGILYHYQGMYDSSNVYIQKAIDTYDELFAKSVTNEVASFLVNDNVRPYRSKPYELANLYQVAAFNFLASGNAQDALVETRRMQLLFDEWERKDKSDVKYTSDGMFHLMASVIYDALGEFDNAMISLYKSVEAYQSGPVALPKYVGNYAYKMFELNDRSSDNELLKLTLSDENVLGVENNVSEIVFVGYSGKGPTIEEITWSGTYVKDGLLVLTHKGPDGKLETLSLPAPPIPADELLKADKDGSVKSGTTFHIKFALPSIKTYESRTKTFKVHCDAGEPFTSTVVNNFDKQLAKNLKDTEAITLARTVARVVIRTITSEQVKSNVATSSGLANLLINVGTDVLADQLEKADTRNCFFLPKTVQIARIPVTPGVHTVDVAALDGAGQVVRTQTFTDIEVGANQKKFVFYTSLE